MWIVWNHSFGELWCKPVRIKMNDMLLKYWIISSRGGRWRKCDGGHQMITSSIIHTHFEWLISIILINLILFLDFIYQVNHLGNNANSEVINSWCPLFRYRGMRTRINWLTICFTSFSELDRWQLNRTQISFFG